jgi:hypothetical protein
VIMRVSYAHFEFVDDVMTLTLAEGPGEAGRIVHFMRAMWEDDSHTHNVTSGSGVSIDSAIRAWHMDGNRLSTSLRETAALKLGFEEQLELELDLAGDQVAEVHERLTEILVDVSET